MFASDVWFPLNIGDIVKFEKVDIYFKRKILKAQAKTPIISIHLELGCLKLRHIILKGRLMYFHTLLNKDSDELTQKILKKQESEPTKGDFITLIKNDMEYLGINYDINELQTYGKDEFKVKVKNEIQKTAFKE